MVLQDWVGDVEVVLAWAGWADAVVMRVEEAAVMWAEETVMTTVGGRG